MKFKISKDRKTLTISADAKERKFLRAETNIQSDKAMLDYFEHLTSHSELEWIDASLTGDLTSAPMLAIFGDQIKFKNLPEKTAHKVTGSDGKNTFVQPILERWAFIGYQTRSVLENLRDNGKAIFTGGGL